MTFQKISISVISLLLMAACNNSDLNNSDVLVDSLNIIHTDTTPFVFKVDTTSVLHDSLIEAGYVEETAALATVIEKKYGIQWDFCDCVVKNDSINKVTSDLDGVSDEQVDIIFARWDEIELHCKELLTAPNTTPEERSKYSKKVKRCLRKAGIN